MSFPVLPVCYYSGNVARIPSVYRYINPGYCYIDPLSNGASDCITLNDSGVQDWFKDIQLGILAKIWTWKLYIMIWVYSWPYFSPFPVNLFVFLCYNHSDRYMQFSCSHFCFKILARVLYFVIFTCICLMSVFICNAIYMSNICL